MRSLKKNLEQTSIYFKGRLNNNLLISKFYQQARNEQDEIEIYLQFINFNIKNIIQEI
ncbi:unnamed protein product [Paramecium sonneborni]|uniref:Uncharacterized protein n=1 Tax=Paramecium sonneborni TaxID=65129 RepID=A0A8S1RLL5_9CILI|nr:unnamed protein product [Paramecium sonneborni]